jgi:hypothetical protein
VRWWVFEGSPWQIAETPTGLPARLDPRVYADLDAALRLAERYDLYYDLVLFASPGMLPRAWLSDPRARARLPRVLRPLFARHGKSRRILSWEVFNEPEWDIWSGRVDKRAVQATVRAVAGEVHADSRALVTVGSARLDGVPMWKGLGLDYYEAHWYDKMGRGAACLPCRRFAAVRRRYGLDRPLVVGEIYAGKRVPALARLRTLYADGYAGAWAWSLFPEFTNGSYDVDLGALAQFTAGRADVGPKRPGL